MSFGGGLCARWMRPATRDSVRILGIGSGWLAGVIFYQGA
ncbi:MAG: hypothetical protein RI897_2200 [Verrucomicrobiota bacterium]|jgi:hypothetical protein